MTRLARPRSSSLNAFQLDAGLFHDGLAAGQDRDVFQHGLAAVAEARGLHGADIERSAQLVDHQRGQRFAFHFFGDQQQRLAGAGDLLENRQHVLHAADLLFVDQDVGIFEHAFHALGIGHEVRREVAAVELHAVHGLQLGGHGLGFLHRDHAVLADLLHRFGDDVADGGIAIGGNAADLRDHVAGDGLRELLDFFHRHFDGLVDAALDGHRVRARGDRLDAFAEDRLGQNGGGGGAVAGDVGSLRCHFAHHLRAHVLERILQLDLFRHRHAVFGDGRSAELLFENDVASLGAERHLHRLGELVDAAQDRLAGVVAINNLFCHDGFLLSRMNYVLSWPLWRPNPERRERRPRA